MNGRENNPEPTISEDKMMREIDMAYRHLDQNVWMTSRAVADRCGEDPDRIGRALLSLTRGGTVDRREAKHRKRLFYYRTRQMRLAQ